MPNRRLEIGLNLGFWMVIFLLLYTALGQRLRATDENGSLEYYVIYDPFVLWLLVLDLSAKMILFYGNLRKLVPQFLLQKVYSKYVFFSLLLFIGTLFYTLFLSWLSMKLLQYPLGNATYLLPFSLLFHFIMLPLSIAYAYIKQQVKQEIKKEQMAKEKLQTELQFLKNQINPHFLFNTLNNIYATSSQSQDWDTAKSIAKLSRMMRYMIYESETKLVPISKELKYIKDFIALEKMRLPPTEEIRIHYQEEVPNTEVLIAPMLFIPLIENAFKHGISYSKPSFIKIKIQQKDCGDLLISVHNSKHLARKTAFNQHKGIGLSNLKKRLGLLYPDRYKLHLDHTENSFTAKLQINLEND